MDCSPNHPSDLEHVIIHMGPIHLLNNYLNPGAKVTKMNKTSSLDPRFSNL